MASPDVVLQAPDVVGVPMTYTVPAAQEIIPLAVTAAIDGSGAAGQYVPTLEIVAPSGAVMARSPTTTIVAAGGSANVSWFPLSHSRAASAGPLTTYETLVLATGVCTLYWKLDDAIGSATVADTVDGNTGTVFGGVTLGQPKLADVTSAAFTAGMVGRKVDSLGVQANGKMTALVWIKTAAVAATSVIAWADTSSADGRWFQWAFNAAGVMSVIIFDQGATGHAFAGAIPINDNVKHMVAFTIDCTNPLTGAGMVGSIYVDNALDTATAIATGGSPLADHNHALVIGARWRNAADGANGNLQLVGTLDEFAIFNGALSLAQLQAINAAGRVT